MTVKFPLACYGKDFAWRKDTSLLAMRRFISFQEVVLESHIRDVIQLIKLSARTPVNTLFLNSVDLIETR